MPSSRFNHIPTVLNVVRQLNPQSLLDIGIGFGKWGHLFREYLEIVSSEREPERYNKPNWQIRIDGIEGYSKYITPAHEYYYNNLYIGDMLEKLPKLGRYDVVFMGDVIEHIEKQDGLDFLSECRRHANKAVIVTTPSKWVPQGAACDNPLEIHRSFWTPADLVALGNTQTTTTENDILVAVLASEGVAMPLLQSAPVHGPLPPRRSGRSVLRRLRTKVGSVVRRAKVVD